MFGSPDILPLFQNDKNVFGESYDESFEDFSRENSDYLDTWVEERAFEFFNVENKMQRNHANGEIYFFHLLGSDTNGHAHKPASFQYRNNVNVADRIIKNLENLIENYFDNDGMTTYIITSDHGMTDWGSHGAGSYDEVTTFVAAWGAGVKAHKSNDQKRDCTYSDLENDEIVINQIDLAPFMSSLISIPIPANSIGDFHWNLINGTSENIKTMFKDNILQLLNQLEYKEANSFRRFSSTAKTIKSQIENAKDFSELKSLEELVQNGIKFYHRAHRPILASLVVFGVLSWMLFTVILILSSTSIRFQISSRYNVPKVFIFISSIISVSIVVLLKLKSHHIIWFLFGKFFKILETLKCSKKMLVFHIKPFP